MTEQLGQQIGFRAACQALDVPRSSLYRKRQPAVEGKARPKPSRTLTPEQIFLASNSLKGVRGF
jgi:hypothetical protein